jgi:hypothetical protein
VDQGAVVHGAGKLGEVITRNGGFINRVRLLSENLTGPFFLKQFFAPQTFFEEKIRNANFLLLRKLLLSALRSLLTCRYNN